jgi:hypothetical protein
MKINFKSLFFSVAAAMSVFMLFSFGNTTNNLPEKSAIVSASLLSTVNIHESFTSEDGCTFTIKGVLTYSWTKFEVTGFVGTVTLTGENCSGSYTFDLIADIQSQGNDIQAMNWASESMQAVKLVNGQKASLEIEAAFENAVK